jgi:hypothetical protein
MKEKAGNKLSKKYRQLRGWYLISKLTLLLPSLAIGRLIHENRKIRHEHEI